MTFVASPNDLTKKCCLHTSILLSHLSQYLNSMCTRRHKQAWLTRLVRVRRWLLNKNELWDFFLCGSRTAAYQVESGNYKSQSQEPWSWKHIFVKHDRSHDSLQIRRRIGWQACHDWHKNKLKSRHALNSPTAESWVNCSLLCRQATPMNAKPFGPNKRKDYSSVVSLKHRREGSKKHAETFKKWFIMIPFTRIIATKKRARVIVDTTVLKKARPWPSK